MKTKSDKNPININDALIRKMKWEILKLISLSISTGDKNSLTKNNITKPTKFDMIRKKREQLKSQCANNCLKYVMLIIKKLIKKNKTTSPNMIKLIFY